MYSYQHIVCSQNIVHTHYIICIYIYNTLIYIQICKLTNQTIPTTIRGPNVARLNAESAGTLRFRRRAKVAMRAGKFVSE